MYQVRRMMGLLPVEPFFPEERPGVVEEDEESFDFQTEFDLKTTSLPGVFSDPRASLSPENR